MGKPFVDIKNLKKAFAKFNKDVETFVKTVPPEVARRSLQALALEGLKRVTEATPVLTGRAAGNWQIGINKVEQGEIERFGGEVALAEESKKIGGVTTPFGFISLQNNVPYILPILEGGHSKKIQPGELTRIIQDLDSAF